MPPPKGDPLAWIARRRLSGLWLRGRGAAAPEDVVAHLTAMQAQDHGAARWSVGQRMDGAARVSDVNEAFDDGRFLRIHVLRPTWHYVAAPDLRWLVRLSGPRIDASIAPKYRQLELDARTLAAGNDVIAAAVAATPLTRREVVDVLERHGFSTVGERATFLLMHAELTGVICSGPMRTKQHTYAAFDDRVPGDAVGLEGDEARAELAARYFAARGPATVEDFAWWSGMTRTEARRALAAVQSRFESFELDGTVYWLADGGPERLPPLGEIDLIQCFDEAVVAYCAPRDALRSPHTAFQPLERVDGFQHLLLLDGRLLGHWRVRSGGAAPRVEVRVAKELDPSERRALDRSIDRYCTFAGS